MKVTIICDPNWSTGSIAKDLINVLPQHQMRIQSWSEYGRFDFREDEVLLCFSLTVTSRWTPTRRKKAIHICCHPHEAQLTEFRTAMADQPANLFFGGVSRECQQAVETVLPNSYAQFLPATARAGRFQRRARPGKRIAGFIGKSTSQNTLITGGIKRPEHFRYLCESHGLTPKFSNQDYRYETMQDFYDGIDYLICTSSSEGGPLGPFEAALCGVPVISTPVGLWGESKMGGYFNDFSDPRFAQALASATDLAENQYRKMQAITMESHSKIWDAAICAVGSNP